MLRRPAGACQRRRPGLLRSEPAPAPGGALARRPAPAPALLLLLLLGQKPGACNELENIAADTGPAQHVAQALVAAQVRQDAQLNLQNHASRGGCASGRDSDGRGWCLIILQGLLVLAVVEAPALPCCTHDDTPCPAQVAFPPPP